MCSGFSAFRSARRLDAAFGLVKVRSIMTGATYLSDSEARLIPKARAYGYIREQIVTGVWAGGHRLQPERIARALGISRMPVRDAISQLDSEGLVTMRPNQGAVVTLLPLNELSDLFEIRAVLEGLAARKAAEVMGPNDLEELQLLSERLMRNDFENPKWQAYHDQFHDAVSEIGQQKHLQREIRRIRTAVQPYIIIYFQEYRHSEMVGDEHKMLLDAIASGNGLLAERTFRDHVLWAGRSTVNFIAMKQNKTDGGVRLAS